MGWYSGVPMGPVRSDVLAASWISISWLPPLGRGFAAALYSPSTIWPPHQPSHRYGVTDRPNSQLLRARGCLSTTVELEPRWPSRATALTEARVRGVRPR